MAAFKPASPKTAVRKIPDRRTRRPGIKSLFASFSSEKEESSFFEKKEAKKLLCLALSNVTCQPVQVKSRHNRRDCGFALLIVLWSLALLALLGALVTGAGRTETRLAYALRRGAQLQEAADGAIYETIWHMLDGGGDYWPPGQMTRVLDEPAGRVVVTVEDERGKMDINQVPPGYLQALFSLLGADSDTATNAANAVADWRSQQPAGGQADSPLNEQYRRAGRIWGPIGEEFQRLDDLLLVLGLPQALAEKATPYLTLALEQGPWLSHAGPVVSAALAKAKHDSGLAVEDSDPRGPVVLRLTAHAVGRNGAAFTRRVLFRLDGTLSGPAWRYRILDWEDGPAS
jgi:general secretion pathway protein K